jgi:branched-chain amino acid transport system permease protein
MVYKIVAEDDRKYVEEFREAPITAHRSPGLQRVLNIMRLYRGGDQYILIARKEFHDYVIGRMPPLRDDPIVIEDDTVFTSREAAEWELFCRRWRQHTGEIINQHYEDKTA